MKGQELGGWPNRGASPGRLALAPPAVAQQELVPAWRVRGRGAGNSVGELLLLARLRRTRQGRRGGESLITCAGIPPGGKHVGWQAP